MPEDFSACKNMKSLFLRRSVCEKFVVVLKAILQLVLGGGLSSLAFLLLEKVGNICVPEPGKKLI
jgi:hypothetical protein